MHNCFVRTIWIESNKISESSQPRGIYVIFIHMLNTTNDQTQIPMYKYSNIYVDNYM